MEQWTGDLVGKMHNEKIRLEDVASVLGVTKAYVSMLLNCKRKPKDAREKLEHAVEEIIRRKREGETDCHASCGGSQ